MKKAASIEELGEGNVKRLLWQYALPAIIGTLANSLYNIIDRIFIGHWVGDDALSALGLILPITNITTAVGMLVGAGSASRMSICLGENNKETAEKIAGTSFLMTFVLSGLTILFIYLNMESILTFAGASSITYPYARDFLIIFLPGNLFLSLCFNFNNMMRASGYPFKAMNTMLLSVLVNIILAPIFIKWFGWGIKGAAAATFGAMVIGFLFVMHHFTNRNSFIRLRIKNIRADFKIMSAITSIGLSPFFMQLAASAIVFFIIHQLKKYAIDPVAGVVTEHSGDVAIGAFTIANTLIMLIAMIIIGLTQGMQPIIGYNYGAKKYKRVKDTLVYTIKIGLAISTTGFILGFFFPKVFVSIFGPSGELAEVSAVALKYITLAFVVVGFQIVVANFFQSIGMAWKAIFLSLSRQVLFLVPSLFILPRFLGLNGVWLSMPTADFLATITTLIMLLLQIRTFRKLEIQNSGIA